MLTELVAAANGIKVAGRVVAGMINVKSTSEVQAKAIELNQLILAAQSDLLAANLTQTTLVEQVCDLEDQIARMKAWEAQKKRYELAAPFPGCMVYALKRSMANGQTPHYLCTSCYQKGQPSILQDKEGRHHPKEGPIMCSYYCSHCGSQAFTQWLDVSAPEYFADIVPQA